MHDLDLTVDEISKIEGKAACDIKVRDGRVLSVKFKIAEYKRFYTQAIRGKDVLALPQLTSRICGTCSNAHILCAIKAVENALQVNPTSQTIMLRKLLNYGLIIRDHALHLYIFVLPDLFNKDSILDFDETKKDEHKWLDDAFEVKSAGNMLSKIVGGRSVHAPYPVVGGFLKIPKKEELVSCASLLKKIRPKVLDLIELFARDEQKIERSSLIFSALIDSEFSFLDGYIFQNYRTILREEMYGEFLDHIAIPYSHASGYKMEGKVFMVGALARVNLAKNRLNKKTRETASKYLEIFPSKNIFHNNLAQAIEILHAIDSSVEIIENIDLVEEKPLMVEKKEGTGTGVIEAPRGTLFYKLEVDKTGKVKEGQIIVPTGENQIGIEESISQYLSENIARFDKKEDIELEVEKIVRAYDPCTSCASHFLKFRYL